MFWATLTHYYLLLSTFTTLKPNPDKFQLLRYFLTSYYLTFFRYYLPNYQYILSKYFYFRGNPAYETDLVQFYRKSCLLKIVSFNFKLQLKKDVLQYRNKFQYNLGRIFIFVEILLKTDYMQFYRKFFQVSKRRRFDVNSVVTSLKQRCVLTGFLLKIA